MEKYECIYCVESKWTTDFSDRLKAHYIRFHSDKINNDPKKLKDSNGFSIGIQLPVQFKQNIQVNSTKTSTFLKKSKSLNDLNDFKLNPIDFAERFNEKTNVFTQTSHIFSSAMLKNCPIQEKIDKSTSPIKNFESKEENFEIPQSQAKNSQSFEKSCDNEQNSNFNEHQKNKYKVSKNGRNISYDELVYEDDCFETIDRALESLSNASINFREEKVDFKDEDIDFAALIIIQSEKIEKLSKIIDNLNVRFDKQKHELEKIFREKEAISHKYKCLKQKHSEPNSNIFRDETHISKGRHNRSGSFMKIDGNVIKLF
ncbi:unnamed protein product [Brachionus calyciflorus]|uniref:Uncharacterized protein n=1 Tax=Brachionus calyciflorus TaxID=104777 RepID=A0A814GVK9_9BILA|nr:unnamed protein product [Brachionus calyciflorus]